MSWEDLPSPSVLIATIKLTKIEQSLILTICLRLLPGELASCMGMMFAQLTHFTHTPRDTYIHALFHKVERTWLASPLNWIMIIWGQALSKLLLTVQLGPDTDLSLSQF